MRRSGPFFAWILALLLVGHFALSLSLNTTWTTVECVRSHGEPGQCNFTTRSLTWDMSHTVDVDTIGGYFIEPQEVAYKAHWRLWMDTAAGAVPVTSLHSDQTQVEVVAAKIREFVVTPNQVSLRFEENMPWTTWEKSALAFALALMLPFGWRIADGVQQMQASRGLLRPSASTATP